MEATNVFSLVGIVAVGVLLGMVFLCNLAVVAGLRSFGLDVPFSLSFHVFKRRRPELFEALKGRSINTYVLISGLLLFALPLFAGLTAYDYVVRRYIEHSVYKLNNLGGAVVLLAVLGIVGAWISISQWQKSAESGIGIALLAILVLKVLTDTLSAMRVIVLVLPAALCAAFVYLAIRRIRRPFTERRYSSGSDQRVARNFISEEFIPNEQYKVQQKSMAQSLIAAGVSAEEVAGRPSHPVDLSMPESHS
jgi:hypothetical protein